MAPLSPAARAAGYLVCMPDPLVLVLTLVAAVCAAVCVGLFVVLLRDDRRATREEREAVEEDED